MVSLYHEIIIQIFYPTAIVPEGNYVICPDYEFDYAKLLFQRVGTHERD